ncbi:MAG: hypothetical protein R3B13_36895 [Polyangiaceae bacterium]
MRAPLLLLVLMFPACMREESPEPESRVVAASKSTQSTKASPAAGVCGDTVESCAGGSAHAAAAAAPAGCSCGAHDNKAATAALTPPQQAKVGDRTTCVVSGGKFVVRPETVFVSHEGKSYPMCCPGCAVRFGRDPKQFLDS